MLDALTLDQMRIFVAIAETGSFRAAAAGLSRVQSAVSHAIGNLEAELGVALFDRSRHRPVLTPEGEALLANARDILLRVDAMRARARGMGEGVELELSLVVDTLFPIATRVSATRASRWRHHRRWRWWRWGLPGIPWRCGQVARLPASPISPTICRSFSPTRALCRKGATSAFCRLRHVA